MSLIDVMDEITWMEYQMAIQDGRMKDLEEVKLIEYGASILSTYLATKEKEREYEQ